MWLLFIQAYFYLLLFEVYLRRGSFNDLHERVQVTPRMRSRHPDAVQRVCQAMDLACIWYWKQALCLQRSSALACLLKRYGVPAQLVIGAQQMPFRSHAWVEVDGRVVNDKPYVSEVYAVLDRC